MLVAFDFKFDVVLEVVGILDEDPYSWVRVTVVSFVN